MYIPLRRIIKQIQTMQHLIDLLHQQECSLVVRSKAGEVTTYHKKGVRDLVWLLDHDAERLRGAVIAGRCGRSLCQGDEPIGAAFARRGGHCLSLRPTR